MVKQVKSSFVDVDALLNESNNNNNNNDGLLKSVEKPSKSYKTSDETDNNDIEKGSKNSDTLFGLSAVYFYGFGIYILLLALGLEIYNNYSRDVSVCPHTNASLRHSTRFGKK